MSIKLSTLCTPYVALREVFIFLLLGPQFSLQSKLPSVAVFFIKILIPPTDKLCDSLVCCQELSSLSSCCMTLDEFLCRDPESLLGQCRSQMSSICSFGSLVPPANTHKHRKMRLDKILKTTLKFWHCKRSHSTQATHNCNAQANLVNRVCRQCSFYAIPARYSQ